MTKRMTKRLQEHFKRRAKYVAGDFASLLEACAKDVRRTKNDPFADAEDIRESVHEAMRRVNGQQFKDYCKRLDAIADEEFDAIMASYKKDVPA